VSPAAPLVCEACAHEQEFVRQPLYCLTGPSGTGKEVHYLALTCRADVLAARLRARPAWREWDEPRIAEMLGYAAWLKRNAATLAPPVELLDTTERSIAETAAAVCAWLTALSTRRKRSGPSSAPP
jgi:hypothetical protein